MFRKALPWMPCGLRRRRLPRRIAHLACLLAALTGFTAPVAAQHSDQTPRKLLYREDPGYPATLRNAHIGGIVRLEIVISSRGSVDTVLPLGGNPALVEAATVAVRKWKYTPAGSETRTRVEFVFNPRR